MIQAGTATPDPAKARRVELILRQIDSLPTLPSVATRLLALTSDDHTDAKDVVELIVSDPALTSKILGICRKSDLGVREEVTTVDTAVVLLGFNTVRNAVLSIKVFEIFSGKAAGWNDSGGAGGEDEATGQVQFDRKGFWRHCLATAIASERIASIPGSGLKPGEAFVCGLLHDLGKLALDHVLPKSFSRAAELAEINQGNIADYERRVVGIDHHTAGKRLAEQWHLSHQVQDCIWLHGSPYEMLPRLEHRRMIGLVSLADLIVRRSHVGYSGNFQVGQEPEALARAIELDPVKIEKATRGLHKELERRSQAMGLDEEPSQELYLRSIQQANQMLGRLNSVLERRSRSTAKQSQILDAISAFHASNTPGRSVEEMLSFVATSAMAVLGAGYYSMIHQSGPGDPWLLCQFNGDGQAIQSQFVDPPETCPELSLLDATQPMGLSLLGILPWIKDYLNYPKNPSELRLLPLGSGWGTAAILIHDRSAMPPWPQLAAIATTWGSAIAAKGQHDGARSLSEELAHANRVLSETQGRLLQSESLARVGEVAAGAAHEMNNPLAIISGRAQLLAQVTTPGSKAHLAAQMIVEQSHRLSDLITALRSCTATPVVKREVVDLSRVLDEVVQTVRGSKDASRPCPAIQVKLQSPQMNVLIDPKLFKQAVAELVFNAVQADPKTGVRVQARMTPSPGRLLIEVIDDGVGMDAHTLEHAFDPFFSVKPAGRRIGMGLPRAKQLVGAHGGAIEIRSNQGQGTVVILWVPLDSGV